MAEAWENELKAAEVQFMKEIIEQVPEGLPRNIFVVVLNKIAAPDKETQRCLDKLAALEGGGVDNWDGYDWAMEDLRTQWEEEDAEAEEDDNEGEPA